MNIEIEIWPYVHINTQYIIRFVGYRIIYRSITIRIPISSKVTIESRPAPYLGKLFTLPITAHVSTMLLPPVGIVNSDGQNLFIGYSL